GVRVVVGAGGGRAVRSRPMHADLAARAAGALEGDGRRVRPRIALGVVVVRGAELNRAGRLGVVVLDGERRRRGRAERGPALRVRDREVDRLVRLEGRVAVDGDGDVFVRAVAVGPVERAGGRADGIVVVGGRGRAVGHAVVNRDGAARAAGALDGDVNRVAARITFEGVRVRLRELNLAEDGGGLGERPVGEGRDAVDRRRVRAGVDRLTARHAGGRAAVFDDLIITLRADDVAVEIVEC